jgi:hypothetical protein
MQNVSLHALNDSPYISPFPHNKAIPLISRKGARNLGLPRHIEQGENGKGNSLHDKPFRDPTSWFTKVRVRECERSWLIVSVALKSAKNWLHVGNAFTLLILNTII